MLLPPGRPCRVDSDAAKRFVRHAAARGSAPLEESVPLAIQRHFRALGLALDAKEPEVRLAYQRMVQAHETSDAPDDKRLKLATQAHDAICEHLGQQPWSRMPPPRDGESPRAKRRKERDQKTSDGKGDLVVADAGQLNRLIHEGFAQRTTSATAMNDASSRSHCVFTICLHYQDTADSSRLGMGHVQKALVWMIGNHNGRSLDCV
eukprot:s608_g30.t1